MSSQRTKVLVAMSGGVDSSVAAALLVERGYDVVGCFMRLGTDETEVGLVKAEDSCATPQGGTRKQGCCSVGDAADARQVAAQLGIPLYVCNFKREFGRIIDYFVDEYAAGRTPNPCVRCNDWLKFGRLHEYAQQLGATHVASGHYARVRGTPARLMRGLDANKDQSYVLFGVPQTQLRAMLLPIGEMHKSDVRAEAERLGLPVFDKPDSQEICFVPSNDYASFVESRRPSLRINGEVVDLDGRRLARHEGQHRFTVGQRRGLGVTSGEPLYVLDKDAESNRVTVGPRDQLGVASCVVGESNWLGPDPLGADWTRCLAQYRAHGRAVEARARIIPDHAPSGPSGRIGRFELQFSEHQDAVAPGQALVLYDAREPETVMGGGWIVQTCRPDADSSGYRSSSSIVGEGHAR